jgi:hypothetical protein
MAVVRYTRIYISKIEVVFGVIIQTVVDGAVSLLKIDF